MCKRIKDSQLRTHYWTLIIPLKGLETKGVRCLHSRFSWKQIKLILDLGRTRFAVLQDEFYRCALLKTINISKFLDELAPVLRRPDHTRKMFLIPLLKYLSVLCFWIGIGIKSAVQGKPKNLWILLVYIISLNCLCIRLFIRNL